MDLRWSSTARIRATSFALSGVTAGGLCCSTSSVANACIASRHRWPIIVHCCCESLLDSRSAASAHFRCASGYDRWKASESRYRVSVSSTCCVGEAEPQRSDDEGAVPTPDLCHEEETIGLKDVDIALVDAHLSPRKPWMHDGSSVPVGQEVELFPLVAWHVPRRLDQRFQQFLLLWLEQHAVSHHELPHLRDGSYVNPATGAHLPNHPIALPLRRGRGPHPASPGGARWSTCSAWTPTWLTCSAWTPTSGWRPPPSPRPSSSPPLPSSLTGRSARHSALDDLFQGVGASCPQAARCEDEGGRPGSALQTQRRALEARWTPPWTPSPPHCTSPPTTC